MHKAYKHLIDFLSTGFFTGYIPGIPGTYGTLLAVFFYTAFPAVFRFQPWTIIILIILSVFISDYAENFIFLKKDSPKIVIDEIAGYLLILSFFVYEPYTPSAILIILSFVLFRFFDIVKPFPINYLQNLPGGIGIVFDDLLAGIYALIILIIIKILFPSLLPVLSSTLLFH